MKSAAKFLLCENFQRHSCSYIILHLTVRSRIAGDVPIYLKFALKVTYPFQKCRFRHFA